MIPVQSQYRVFGVFSFWSVFISFWEPFSEEFSLLEKCSYFSLFPVLNLSLSSNRGPIFTLTLYGFMPIRHGYMHLLECFHVIKQLSNDPCAEPVSCFWSVFISFWEPFSEEFSLLEKCSYFSLFPVLNLSLSSNRGPIFTLTLYGFMPIRHGYMHLLECFHVIKQLSNDPCAEPVSCFWSVFILECFHFILRALQWRVFTLRKMFLLQSLSCSKPLSFFKSGTHFYINPVWFHAHPTWLHAPSRMFSCN